jgi:hypothetical protein
MYGTAYQRPYQCTCPKERTSAITRPLQWFTIITRNINSGISVVCNNSYYQIQKKTVGVRQILNLQRCAKSALCCINEAHTHTCTSTSTHTSSEDTHPLKVGLICRGSWISGIQFTCPRNPSGGLVTHNLREQQKKNICQNNKPDEMKS